MSTACSGIRIPPFLKASEQLRDFEGRGVHCPECEGGCCANTGPKKASRSAGLKPWREYGGGHVRFNRAGGVPKHASSASSQHTDGL
jgi:hypothetical protein